MRPTEIHQLLVYGSKVWPRTFPIPTLQADLAITVQVWQDILGDLDPEHIRTAMSNWPDEWPPTPRRLRDATTAVMREAAGVLPPPDHEEAFEEVLRAVKVVGYTRTPEWSHPAIGRAVAAVGGWRKGICESENLPALRAHFRQVYEPTVVRLRQADEAPIPILARQQPSINAPRRIVPELVRPI